MLIEIFEDFLAFDALVLSQLFATFLNFGLLDHTLSLFLSLFFSFLGFNEGSGLLNLFLSLLFLFLSFQLILFDFLSFLFLLPVSFAL